MEISDVLKFQAIEEENRKLKRLVADLSLDNQVLKDIIEKNFYRPRPRKKHLMR